MTLDIPTMSPRRLTIKEETALLKAESRMRVAEKEAEGLRARRNALILDLLEKNFRVADIADVLQLTPKAIHDARRRAREAR